jgi:hypothetical protein
MEVPRFNLTISFLTQVFQILFNLRTVAERLFYTDQRFLIFGLFFLLWKTNDFPQQNVISRISVIPSDGDSV